MDTIAEPSTILVFAARKPGMSFDEFKSYYEERHAPLVMSFVLHSDSRPLSYTRHYIKRDSDSEGKAPSFPFGGADSWDYDCIARTVFRDDTHRDLFFSEFAEHRDAIAEDEAKFLDRSKLRILYASENISTVRRES